MEYVTHIIAFLIGCLYTRTYYARIKLRTDWWRSTNWFSGKWWKKFHEWNCELCPKRWYCPTYEETKNDKHL